MSRELDFIDFINENADVENHTKHYQHRPTRGFSKRSLLANASPEDIQDALEKDMVITYQNTLCKLRQKEQELDDTNELWSNIYAGNDKNYLTMKKQLQDEASKIASQRDDLDRQLIELEKTPTLQKVIEREKEMLYNSLAEKAEQSRKEALDRAREQAAKTEQELMARYQESRKKAIQRREEARSQLKQETVPEAPKEEQRTESPKENKLMNIMTSKRIAAIISLLLCITLYLSFLSAFTTKRDTYICYTTKTDDYYHSATCLHIKNSVSETTVYKAAKKYSPCSSCNPCIERYATTITERNYVIPMLISAPISAGVFLLLTYKKER